MQQDGPTPESTRERALRVLAELGGGLLAGLVVMGLARPSMFTRAARALWIPTGDPYVIGDQWGTLFLVLRSARGEAGCETRLFQWPEGADLCRDFPNSLFTELLAPAVDSLGLPLGYNLAMLALFLSNGLAAGLAARVSGANALGGALAIALGAATPMVFYEVFAGRPVTAWWAPALAATAACAASLRTWRSLPLLLPGLACLALALWIYPYAVVMLLPWTLLLGLERWWQGPGKAGRALRGALGLGAAAGVAVWVARAEYGEALARFLEPLPYGDAESRWGMATATVFDGVVHWHGVAAVAALLLPLMALSRRWPRGLGAALAAALLLLVSLGPVPFGDPRREAPQAEAPYVQLMERVPVMRGSARPDRYGIAAALLLAVAAGAALGGPGRLRGARGAVALGGLLALTAFNRQLTPIAWFDWPALDGLSELPQEGAALDLPLFFAGEDQAHMMAFATWPVPRMNPLRQQRQAWAAGLPRRGLPLISALYALERGQAPGAVVHASAEQALGLRWVVLHRALLDVAAQEAHAALLRQAGAEEVVRTEDVGVWRLY